MSETCVLSIQLNNLWKNINLVARATYGLMQEKKTAAFAFTG